MNTLEHRLGAYMIEYAEKHDSIAFSLCAPGEDGHGASAMSLFGKEADDSPMAGGSGIGAGDTIRDAVEGLLTEARR